MKKLILFAGVLFLSTAVLTSCGSKDEKKDEDKKEEKKDNAEEANDDSSDESSSTSSGSWPASVQEAYLSNCVNGAKSGMTEEMATTYCQCTMDKLMARYPDAMELQNLGGDEINELAMECLAGN